MFNMSFFKFLRSAAALALLLAFALLAPGVQRVQAAGIVVNTLADGAPANDGACTLREAITNANNDNQSGSTDCPAGSGADSITFSVSGTITLVETLPTVTDPDGLTIDGAGQSITVSGNNTVGVMVVNSGAALELKSLTIANGHSSDPRADVHGGIANAGTLTVTNSTFSGNSASVGGGISNGNTGTLTVTNSTFSGNDSSSAGGGINNNLGTVTVTNSTFFANSGGGIANIGTVTVSNSTFSANSASAGGGGGILNNGGTLAVTNSTFSANSSDGGGGGIANSGTLAVTNSTFSANSADFGGGGILNTGGTVTVTNSTFSANSASEGGAIDADGTVTLRNTIVANSPSGGNCVNFGTLNDGGGNLVWGDTSCPGIHADPKLLALADNGGPTQTMALDTGSEALDAAVLANCPETDQRGVSRPQGAGCDIGAYEMEVTNTEPVADANGPYLGAVNTAVQFDGSGSSDPDGDELSYTWDFGDGSSGTGAPPTHSYAAAGIYDVCLTVNDGALDSEPSCTVAVVYDPDGGFVTGGGWIDSPAGAYQPDTDLTGKASFGFVSKYKKGASVPTGNTAFIFDVAGMAFKSDSYEWLVINQGGTNAQFKGSGTVNDDLAPNGDAYKFMLWAGDGSPDTFRIRIWWEDAEGVEIDLYDNGFDQPIGAGNIVVHEGK